MKMRRLVTLTVLLQALTLSAARAEKIRTAIPQANLNYLSIHVADAKGFFQEEGLENETVVISGAPTVARDAVDVEDGPGFVPFEFDPAALGEQVENALFGA